MRLFTVLCAFIVTAFAAGRTSPPSGAVSVGSGQKYATLQAAVNSLSTTSTAAQIIFVYPGTYNEQVKIPARAAALTIYGSTSNTGSYTSNSVTIQHSSSLLSGASSDEATATIQNRADNTKFYNINIKNTYGVGSQALALSAWGNQQGYYGVGLYGYQDTLLSETGNQVFAKCFIQGAVDFIFGQHARTWIDGTTISAIGSGAITASGRPSSSDVSYYVINKSTISGSASSGTVYLGRPWAEYARVCFQDTTMSNVINSAGWEIWSASSPNTGYVVFQEYGNTGAGASDTRASFSSKIGSAISISTILGSSYSSWVDASYLS